MHRSSPSPPGEVVPLGGQVDASREPRCIAHPQRAKLSLWATGPHTSHTSSPLGAAARANRLGAVRGRGLARAQPPDEWFVATVDGVVHGDTYPTQSTLNPKP
jgi:sarcosine oxidase gamma subunit